MDIYLARDLFHLPLSIVSSYANYSELVIDFNKHFFMISHKFFKVIT